MTGSVLGNRTRNFVLRLVVNGAKFTQSEVPNGTALPWVIEKLPNFAIDHWQTRHHHRMGISWAIGKPMTLTANPHR